MIQFLLRYLLLCLCLLCSSVYAIEEQIKKTEETNTAIHNAKTKMTDEVDVGKWSGSVQFGGNANTGNSTSYNYDAAINLEYKKSKWDNNYGATGQIGGSNEGLTSRNYDVNAQSKYFFAPPLRYVYVLTDINTDSFSPYYYVWGISSGYGRRLYSGYSITLDLQAGPGNIRTKQRTNNQLRNEFVIYTGGLLSWKMNQLLTFTENTSYQYGEPTRYIQSVTAINSKIMDNLSLQWSYTVKHTTYIPPDSKNTKKTDTISAISVIYFFR